MDRNTSNPKVSQTALLLFDLEKTCAVVNTAMLMELAKMDPFAIDLLLFCAGVIIPSHYVRSLSHWASVLKWNAHKSEQKYLLFNLDAFHIETTFETEGMQEMLHQLHIDRSFSDGIGLTSPHELKRETFERTRRTFSRGSQKQAYIAAVLAMLNSKGMHKDYVLLQPGVVSEKNLIKDDSETLGKYCYQNTGNENKRFTEYVQYAEKSSKRRPQEKEPKGEPKPTRDGSDVGHQRRKTSGEDAAKTNADPEDLPFAAQDEEEEPRQKSMPTLDGRDSGTQRHGESGECSTDTNADHKKQGKHSTDLFSTATNKEASQVLEFLHFSLKRDSFRRYQTEFHLEPGLKYPRRDYDFEALDPKGLPFADYAQYTRPPLHEVPTAPFPTTGAHLLATVRARMHYEAFRLGTFVHMDADHPCCIRLANAGFFYTFQGRMVQCYSCGLRWDDWQPEQDFYTEHKRRKPECLHVQGKDTSNVPIHEGQSRFHSGADITGENIDKSSSVRDIIWASAENLQRAFQEMGTSRQKLEYSDNFTLRETPPIVNSCSTVASTAFQTPGTGRHEEHQLPGQISGTSNGTTTSANEDSAKTNTDPEYLPFAAQDEEEEPRQKSMPTPDGRDSGTQRNGESGESSTDTNADPDEQGKHSTDLVSTATNKEASQAFEFLRFNLKSDSFRRYQTEFHLEPGLKHPRRDYDFKALDPKGLLFADYAQYTRPPLHEVPTAPFPTTGAHLLATVKARMHYEAFRLGTFMHMDADHPCCLRLANAGFFYAFQGRMIQCYSCGLRWDDWQPEQDFYTEHERRRPECLHVQGNDTSNVPIHEGQSRFRSGADITGENIDKSSSVRDILKTSAANLQRAFQYMETLLKIGNSPPSSFNHVEQNGPGVRQNHHDDASPSMTANPQDESSFTSRSTFICPSLPLPVVDPEFYPSRNSNDDDNDENPGPNRPSLPNVSEPRQNPTQPSANSESGYDPDKALYPDFQERQRRRETFTQWPPHLPQAPDDLADAGFFFAGPPDCVRCFYCGLGLKDWEAEDDPFEEHARRRGTCAYLAFSQEEQIRIRRQELLENRPVGRGNNTSDSQGGQGTRDLLDNMTVATSSAGATPRGFQGENWMMSSAAQNAQSLGFQDEVIQHAVVLLLNTRGGRAAVSTNNLLVAIQFIRAGNQTDYVANSIGNDDGNNDDITGSFFASDNDEISNDSNDDGEDLSATATAAGDAGDAPGSKDSNSIITNNSRMTKNELKKLEEENKELQERMRCKVCLDSMACVLFVPCLHRVCCVDCAARLRKCPMCRRVIRGSVPIAPST